MKQSHCIEDTAGFAEGGDAAGKRAARREVQKHIDFTEGIKQ